MKLPNHKFNGMSQVTKQKIESSISAYLPNANQIGGANRLTLLNEATNLLELIDFCIEGYGAWKDAVLMGAGSYLKIGEYSDEIAVAKEYVKQKVYEYLKGAPFLSEKDYDNWHNEICKDLSDNSKNFQKYSAYRKISTDKFKNKIGFTVGNAQKFLNMLMKDLYACLNHHPSFLENYEEYFKHCHMPLDSYILRFVDDIRIRENIIKPIRTYGWSNLNSYEAYMDEQNDIRSYVKKESSGVTVLQTEFVVWPLYK